MIIKDLTRHSVGGSKVLIEYLLRYCARDTKRTRSFTKEQKENIRLLMVHNIRGRSIDDFIRAFDSNAKHRKDQRINMVQAYHTILSFSPKSTPFLTDKKLRTIVKEYIRLRGSDNIYCVALHSEKKHFHAHIAMGSATLDGLKASRISKKQFAQLKDQMTTFQKIKFPELSDSLPQHGLSRSPELKDKDAIKNWIDRLPSQKRKIAQSLRAAYASTKSLDEFIDCLKKEQIVPYFRGGRLTGVSLQGSGKFRFKNLGFESEMKHFIETNKKEKAVLSEISDIRKRSKE